MKNTLKVGEPIPYSSGDFERGYKTALSGPEVKALVAVLKRIDVDAPLGDWYSDGDSEPTIRQELLKALSAFEDAVK